MTHDRHITNNFKRSVKLPDSPSPKEATENSRYYANLQKTQGSMSQRARSRSASRSGSKRSSVIIASNPGIIENPVAMEKHPRMVNALSVQIKKFNATSIPFRIYHGSTNTTRSDVMRDPEKMLDVSGLSNVLVVDQHRRIASCEPNVSFDQLLNATLPLGLVPPVVPEFPGITVGGAFAGTAGESSSFKYGFVDSIVESVQCILGNGEIKEVKRGDELFSALAGTLGTIGVVTRIDIKLVEAKVFVELKYHRVNSFKDATAKIEECTKSTSKNDFVDGIMYSEDKGVVVTGRMTDHTNGGKIVKFDRRFDDWFYLHAEKMIEKPHTPAKKKSQAKKHLDRWSSSEEDLRKEKDGLPKIDEEEPEEEDVKAKPGFMQKLSPKIRKIKRRIAKLLPKRNKADGDDRSSTWSSSSSSDGTDSMFYKTPAAKPVSDATKDKKDIELEEDILQPPTAYAPLLSYLFRYDRGGFWVARFAFRYFSLPFIFPLRAMFDTYLHTRPMYHALHASGQQQLYLIEDVAVPMPSAPAFLERVTSDLDIFPLWLCPLTFRGADAGGIRARTLPSPASAPKEDVLLNVGVWGPVPKESTYIDANRRLESLVREFKGVKWLYAQMFYDEKEFWEVYDKEAYVALREKYSATKCLPDVYEKVRPKGKPELTEDDIDRTQEKKGALTRVKDKLITVWVFPGLYGLYKAYKGEDYMLKKDI
jgi:FAD/FMN-containing dehydrogenase